MWSLRGRDAEMEDINARTVVCYRPTPAGATDATYNAYP